MGLQWNALQPAAFALARSPAREYAVNAMIGVFWY